MKRTRPRAGDAPIRSIAARMLLTAVLTLVWGAAAFPQAQDHSMLDPHPLDPEKDPDIDNYIGSWKESMPRHTHGSLIERDILTKGDPVNPSRRGAVLMSANRFTHAMLHAGGRTEPVALSGEQEIFYILGGTGEITDGQSTEQLHPGVAVLMPPGLEFTMRNTGDGPLTMYLLSEPVPPGFTPLDAMKVVDENKRPWNAGNPHWVGLSRPIFNKSNGLATIGNIITVRFDPMTIFHPHSHREGQEEVWTTVYGEVYFLLGKEIRKQPPGTAYYIPPTGNTPHSNFNVSDDMVKLFYFSKLN